MRRFTPNLPALLADASLIGQAVTNLVANAIKYSSPKTEVVVEVRANGDALQIEVADRGYGIPADALGRIFEKFYRVPRVEDGRCARHRIGAGARARNRGTTRRGASRLKAKWASARPSYCDCHSRRRRCRPGWVDRLNQNRER